MSILSWLKGAIKSLFTKKELADKLGIPVPADDTAMEEAVRVWCECYRGNAPWLTENTDLKSLDLAHSAAHEMARLVTLEFSSSLSGSPRAEYLSEHYGRVVADADVWCEYACAMGGVFIKPYITADGIAADYVQADAAFPICHDSSGNITACIFAERVKQKNKYYTRLERHELTGEHYTVTNTAYVSDSDSDIGRRISLADVPQWAELSESTELDGISRPLFAYIKIPGANRIDRSSPLGVSVFDGALGSFEEADKQFTRLMWEFEGSELAVYVDCTAVRRNADGTESVPRYNKRLIKTLDFGTDDSFKEFSPDIREASLINGLNQILRQAERQCGLAFGTFSDVSDTDKTAQEIKFSKQRSYATVSAIQSAVRRGLSDYLQVLDIYCDLYGLAPKGKTEQSFDFDDSIITDSESEQKIWLQEVAAGLMSPVEYRMKRYGETEEQALKALPDSMGDI